MRHMPRSTRRCKAPHRCIVCRKMPRLPPSVTSKIEVPPAVSPRLRVLSHAASRIRSLLAVHGSPDSSPLSSCPAPVGNRPPPPPAPKHRMFFWSQAAAALRSSSIEQRNRALPAEPLLCASLLSRAPTLQPVNSRVRHVRLPIEQPQTHHRPKLSPHHLQIALSARLP